MNPSRVCVFSGEPRRNKGIYFIKSKRNTSSPQKICLDICTHNKKTRNSTILTSKGKENEQIKQSILKSILARWHLMTGIFAHHAWRDHLTEVLFDVVAFKP